MATSWAQDLIDRVAALEGHKIEVSDLPMADLIRKIEKTGIAADSVIGGALAPVDPWHLIGAAGNPPFQGTWINSASGAYPAQYKKNADGVVFVEGRISSGSAGSVAFTLPNGYWPKALTVRPLVVSGAIAGSSLSIDTAGNVAVSLNGAAEGFLGFYFHTI